MGLVDLGEPGVDHLLVKLLLLLEPEHLRGLLRQHVHDAVEHRLMEVGIVDGNRLYGAIEQAAKLAGRLQAGERLRAAVNGDDDLPADRLANLLHPIRVLYNETVRPDAPHDARANTTENAIPDGAQPERTHHH